MHTCVKNPARQHEPVVLPADCMNACASSLYAVAMSQQRQLGAIDCRGRAHLFRRAVCWIQDGLIRNIVGPAAQVCTGAKIDQLEVSVILSKDDVHWLHISVYKSSSM